MKRVFFVLCFAFGFYGSAQAQYVEAAKLAYSAYQGYQADNDAAQSTQKILNAIAQAEANILNELTRLQEREVEVCMRAMLIDFTDFYAASRQTQENFAREYLSCITRAAVLVNDKDATTANIVGNAFNVIVPIALTARQSIGFSTREIIDLAKNTNRQISAKLRPTCTSRPISDNPFERNWICRSPLGKVASGVDTSSAAFVTEAGAGSAYEVAAVSLELLNSL